MIKQIALILAGLIFLGCAHWNDLSDAEKAAYERSNKRYEWGQTP